MSYSKQSGFPTHGDCANFRSGFCTLNGVAVNANGAACPNFTPKSPTPTPQIAYRFPSIPYYPPHIEHGHPAPQHSHQYSYPPPYALSPMTAYRYRTRYSSGPITPAQTAFRQGGAGFLSMSSGRRGRGGGSRGRRWFGAGPVGSCVCPSCGYSTPHVAGTPCNQQICPKCGSRMIRAS